MTLFFRLRLATRILLIATLLLFVACSTQKTAESPTQQTSGFCGRSTKGPCESDRDCRVSGCSGQVCQSVKEEPLITTCEWKDCYDAKKFGVQCGCLDQQCQWK